MGIFRKKQAAVTPTSPYRSDGSRPAWMRQDLDALGFTGSAELAVVGEAAYQSNLWSIVGRQDEYVREQVYGFLVPEDGNPHDPNAVAVFVGRNKVGYLSRTAVVCSGRTQPACGRQSFDSSAIRELSAKPIALSGVIAGGGPRARIHSRLAR
jgi:hypothetical protein